MEQNQLSVMGATRINVGLSAIIKVQPSAYQYAETIKILGTGGTLEIVPCPLALTGTSTIGWGLGYPLGATEVLNLAGPAVIYLSSSGATTTVTMALGYTNGATVI